MDTRKDKLNKVLTEIEMRKKSMPADEMMATLNDLPQGVITNQDMARLIAQQNAMPLPQNPPIVRDESMPPGVISDAEVQRMIINRGQGAMPPGVVSNVGKSFRKQNINGPQTEVDAERARIQKNMDEERVRTQKYFGMPSIYKNMQ